jgi:hypothetical protein
MEIESDLRLTSDRMLRTLEQLEALENEKRGLQPGTDRFQRLAVEVERLASTVYAQTHAQQLLGVRAQETVERTGVEIAPIDDAQPNRDLQLILADWRDAERRLSLAEPDSAEHALAASDIGRLRDEYHRAYMADSTQGHASASE